MIIHTKNYTLRSFTPNDATEFFHMVNGDEVIEEYVPYSYVNTMEEACENVEDYSNGDCKNDFYLLIEKNGKMVGAIIAVRMIGMTLDTSLLVFKKYRGKGIMSEALTAFIQWLKKSTQYESLVLVIRNDNLPSIKLAWDCGAELERELEGDLIFRVSLKG